MPQLMLPLISPGANRISDLISVYRDEKRWTYFLGLHPIYAHDGANVRMFHAVTAMMIDSGTCRHADIIKAFGVSKSSVNRAIKKLREGGFEAFFQKRSGGRKGSVLTPQVLEKAQALLDQGVTRQNTAEELKIMPDTLRKAISGGRLRVHQSAMISQEVTVKSERSAQDALAAEGMGTACTRVVDRVFASLGKINGADVSFEACLDVPNGGVLCALPALLCNGLLEGSEEMLGKLKGYYTIFHVLLLLAFMTLCRIKAVDQLRGHAPGEFGKLLGLDRIPEVRCLREKMDALSVGEGAEKWALHLCQQWMKADGEIVGTLYVDGHVRVYHGGLTQLPRQYVTRERLCLRGTTDYWVNDAVGRPFFMIEKVNNPGLLQVLEQDIVPRLLEDIPNQPDDQALQANPLLCRFVLVFDREGYSPAFFLKMWRDHRIACITYHKHPGEDWPVSCFTQQSEVMPSGETVTMSIAEMGTLVGSGKDVIWMREVRKLTDSGHQTSIISTAYELLDTRLAVRMFSRWCQENFFKYARQHFGIDMLSEYGVVEFPDTERVVNPAWRELDRSRNRLHNKLRYRQVRFAEISMHPAKENDPIAYQTWLDKKSTLLEEVEHHQHQLETLKAQLKQTKKHILWKELADEDRFHRLIPGRKRLMDTIRMVAYRAETAMAGLLTGPKVSFSDARCVLQDLFVTSADILPDTENKILRVRIHNASTPAINRSLAMLCEQLNQAEVKYPGTEMQLVYEMVDKGS